MKVAYIAAGAAGMFCGSCLHDNRLAATLLRQGHDVLLVPTYTPLRTDEPDVSHPRVFFNGVNVYLQQAAPWLRWAPRWVDRLLDSPRLLRALTQRPASVDPTRLGALTVSMLRGEQGNQRREVDKLVDWLVDEVRPDVIHLSNSMMLGMARRMAERCGPPVVCALSGEDLFLDQLPPRYRKQADALLRERAAGVHAFTALNDYYADHMSVRLGVPRERVHVVRAGIDLDGVTPRDIAAPADGPLRVGFLARVCRDKGLHNLLSACRLLRTRRPGLDLWVEAAGYLGGGDRPYLEALEREHATGPLAGRFRYLGEPDRAGKFALLRSWDVFSTPTVYREAKGFPALESMACGVPVVLPRHGAFTELVEQTGGGLLYEPGAGAALADALETLLLDPDQRARLGATGRAAVERRHTADRAASETHALYQRLVGGAPRADAPADRRSAATA